MAIDSDKPVIDTSSLSSAALPEGQTQEHGAAAISTGHEPLGSYERPQVTPLANSDAIIRMYNGVSVEQAESDFAELQRVLSEASRVSRSTTHRPHSRAATGQNAATHADVEKGSGSEVDEPFDLEAAIRGGIAREREAGIRPKHIGVYWDKLTVEGIGGAANYVRTFPNAFIEFFDVVTPLLRMLGKGKRGTEVKILDGFRGVCKPGEMVLVLGKPGSGCTTFLKTIANQRYGYSAVKGHVQYGLFDAQQFTSYRGEAVYNGEDDVHHATLTVEQTLGFALDTKTPKKLPHGMTKADFKAKVITLLLKMFNIEHTRHTVVGDHFTRGVSGGERKRVSIAEMMITNACVLSWDNSTRGLDSSTALDFARSLRVITNLYKTATFVSLYQASENIYNLFDKVLVIDQGKQAYFGPASEARSYFESLGFRPRPRQTTPDYLTGCTDEFEREYSPGRSAQDAPHDGASFSRAFQTSSVATALDAEIDDYLHSIKANTALHDDFTTAVHQSKRRGAKRSVYNVGFPQQVWALMKRQFTLKLQDKLELSLSWMRSIIVAIVLGTLYWNLGRTSASAFSKGGLMFIALLFNAFQAFAELGGTMLGRPIVNKHRAYAFHRPSALWIAQLAVDQVFSASQILVFSLIVYLMTNLVRDAGAFFTFFLMILSGNIAMTLAFRIIGCASPGFDSALKVTTIVITLFVLTCGYLIQYQNEHPWLRWLFWVNPLGLALSGLLINEFSRIDMTCTDDSLIPAGPGYHDINHQVCTLPGSTGGTYNVAGSAYLRDGLSYAPSHLWRNWGLVIVLILVFLIVNIMLGELINYGRGGNTALVFQKSNSERASLNESLARKLETRKATGKDQAAADTMGGSSPAIKGVLTWEAVNYDVPVSGGTKRLLNDVYGYVKPGQLTALMGASGAGKTTLLDVLAARKNIGIIRGDILVDGVKPGREFQRSTSYAEQLDMHDPTQTVREALRFSADLRQSFHTPRAEKYAYVEEIISLLEMESIADAVIGAADSGLTVEQRKRVTIGVELAAKPELLLFLDEPTSGLDSQSAFNIVRFLKKLAASGQAILCTIHQPNAALFENFDRLLLLQRGGRCVYFGEIGEDAAILRAYLARHGAEAPITENVAEFMLDAIGAGSAPRVGTKDWADIWADSPELERAKQEIVVIKEERRALATRGGAARVRAGHATNNPSDDKIVKTYKNEAAKKEYASPPKHQLAVVLKRMYLSYWRSPDYLFTRLFNHFVIGFVTGLTFLNLDDSRASLQNRVFIMFQVTVLPALILSQTEVMYNIKRAIFFREASSKMYNTYVFALSMVLAELPYSLLCAVIFFLPIYFMPGLQATPSRAGYQFLMVVVTELFSVTLAQTIAAATPSVFISSQFDPFIMITFALFCGVTIPAPLMPRFWRSWLYHLDPFTRLISGMVTTALHETPVKCKPHELSRFAPPPGSSCADYMASFFAAGGHGYLDNDGGGALCQYCAYRVGDEFYSPLGMRFEWRWRDLGILISMIGSNLIILFLASRFLNFNRR